MSSGLKPLLLPRLVEERRMLEQRADDDGEPTFLHDNYDSSASDLAAPSPVASLFTPTSLSRLSGSATSLELASPPCADTPTSPAQSLHKHRPSKTQLPDVQEEPSEREDEEPATPPRCHDREFEFYNYCLCDAPCAHSGDAARAPYLTWDPEFDPGFLSDGDWNGSPRQKKRRHRSDAGYPSWSTRLGSRLPSLSRLRSASTSSRRHDLAFSPASDPSLADPRPSLSSSGSRPLRGSSDRPEDPGLATPALSFFESAESVVLPPPPPPPGPDAPATLGKSLERDRATATTPLLPPLLIDAAAAHAPPRSLQASPLQSPSIVPSPAPEVAGSATFPTPPLSGRPSVSSLRRATVSSTFSDGPSPVPCLFDHYDAWSDRLGHANFTIEPRPYAPDAADLAALQAFRADWNLARTNYAKHLARTGEHYGSTSKTYALTEAKWAEVEREWQRREDELVERVGQQWKGDPTVVSQLRRTADEKLSPSIPRMLSDDGKFPELGDVEIVGPMVRDAAMARDGQDDRRNSASGWLKNLAGKVGLRK